MRRLPKRLFVAGLAIVFGYAAARVLAPLWSGAPGAAVVRTPHAPTPTPVTTEAFVASPTSLDVGGEAPQLDGNQLALRVLATMERRPNVAAKLRQSLRIGDEILAGDGEYWQQGTLNLRRTCWQTKTLTASEPICYRQVFADGNYLWTDRRHGPYRTVTRVNVGQVMRQLQKDAGSTEFEGQQAFTAEPYLLARGGLSQLLADLIRDYDFAPPRAGRIGELPVLALVGQWKTSELKHAWPDRTEDKAWPEQLPHHVLLEIGGDDLFPYLVEYRSGAQADLAESAEGLAPTASPLARYEFYDVEYAVAIPKDRFEFQPTDVDWQDVTAATIARIRDRVGEKVASKPGETVR